MPHLVLYRKYRPKVFAEIVGQEHIVKTLTNAVKEGIISHGYLLAGPHGTGKTTIARLLAKSLNCQNRKENEFEPCNQCQSCLEINQGSAIDLIEIDAASNRGIDDIRNLRDGIRFTPSKSKYKVFILDEAHQLSKDAANALLKTLEEPPEHAIFVLATTELNKMLPTIQSRCQTFHLKKLNLNEITERLKQILTQEKVKFEQEALKLIALASSGSIRDAESLLDEAVSFGGKDNKIEAEIIRALLGAADKGAVFQLLGFLKEKKAKQGIELINSLMRQGIDLKELIKSLIEHLRQALLFQIDPESQTDLALSLTKEEKEKLLGFAQGLAPKELSLMIEKIMEADNKMKYSAILQLPLELAIVDLCLKGE